MFTLNSKHNIELIPDELHRIKQLAVRCDIDIKDIKFKRNKKLTWRKCVACFSLLHKNTIFFCFDADIDRCFPHICHELIHREQRKRYGLIIYSLLAIPYLRKWTIEPRCYKQERYIEGLI